MMKKTTVAAGALTMMMLSACAGVGQEKPQAQTPDEPALSTRPLGDDEVLSRLGVLKAQNLADGECGLFLWMKRDDAPLVFFQRSDGRAFMAIDGNRTALDRTLTEGRIALEYFERQQFSAKNIAFDVTMAPESKRSLQQGLKIPTASIAVELEGGWSAVVPAVGLIGCK